MLSVILNNAVPNFYCQLSFLKIINNVLCFSICTALELVSSRNIEELVLVLRKEVAKTHNVVEHEDTGKYRQLLVRTLHTCCIKVY